MGEKISENVPEDLLFQEARRIEGEIEAGRLKNWRIPLDIEQIVSQYSQKEILDILDAASDPSKQAENEAEGYLWSDHLNSKLRNLAQGVLQETLGRRRDRRLGE